MSKRKIVVNALLGSLCCFVFLSALHAAGNTSGGSASSANCLTVGEIEERYTADEGCSYQTTIRECCSDGFWSEWGKDCPSLTPKYSKESLTLECRGRYGASQTDGVSCVGGHPTVKLPYPKCPETNICKGKTEGYKCYKSYSPTPKEMIAGALGVVNVPVRDYVPLKGCHTKTIGIHPHSVVECLPGETVGGLAPGSGTKDNELIYIIKWITGASFDIDVVTCERQGS